MSILVLGDLIVDEYWQGTTTRLSPEAPVPIINDIRKTKRAGGAANVALNLHSMGNKIDFISQCDKDTDLGILHDLKANLIPCDQTPHKIRVLTNDHVICRLDNERFQKVTASQNWISADTRLCVISDYNKGFVADSQRIIDWCNHKNIPVIVDPKRSWDHYRGCWLLKANYNELVDQLGGECDIDNLHVVCNDLCQQFGIANLIITLAHRGLFVFTPTGHEYVPSTYNHVIDVTGAGDVVLAAIAHIVSRGVKLIPAAKLANKLAAISIQHQGSYTVTLEDLKTVEEKIVFTNGCFDILHKGHIEYLKQSKSHGTKLIIGLNSDRSVRELKGHTRPINNENDRKALLESLEFVDEVVIFDEPTPRELIMRLRPDIITKGSDYRVDTVVGNDLVDQVIIIPLVENYSTTGILERLK